MFRPNLFIGLLILVTLLWTIGVSAILLMRLSASINDVSLAEAHKKIDATLKVITVTSSLNAHYLPRLAFEESNRAPDRDLWDTMNPQIDEALAVLRLRSPKDERWDDLFARFSDAIENFRKSYEGYFGEAGAPPGERKQLVELINVQTRRLADLSGDIIALLDRELLVTAAGKSVEKNSVVVLILILLGTMMAVIIYFGLAHRLMKPVASLRRSIEEIRRGNYEQTDLDPERSSEFASVVSAFNDMVTDLRIRRGENAENLARVNTVMSSILEAIPSPVFILEDGSGIVQINPAAEKLSEKLGVIGRLPEKIQQIFNVCVETGSNFMPEDPRDALLFRITDVEYYYLPRIFRFKGEATAKSGWAILLHNVSRIRWLDDLKTNLLATVSHEIKTPLTGIRMVLHLLLEDRGKNLSEIQRKMITSANDDSERLLLTLNALLELSRAESGATHLSCAPIRVKDNLERSADLYGGEAAKRNITLRVDPGGDDLPDVFADAVRLDQVINNLLTNAINQSPDGGVVTLCLSKPDADHVRVSVIDQGPGVPEGSKNRIFERFYRAPGQKHEGVGLGLFISREIMRAHEGRIGFNECSDNLTEFYIDVPIA
jgi:two-component system, NtrC family, sensor histidine kinase KinB